MEDSIETSKGIITRSEFDRTVYATGYVRIDAGRVMIEGIFSIDAMELIARAARDKPEWFDLT